MTHITLFKQNGHTVGFEAKDHTGYAESGSDIVCSAISALTQTAVMGIVELMKLTPAYEVSQARIYLMLEKEVSGSELEKAEIILDTMSMGLVSIGNNYGDYIKIVEREV